jgi:hypothetical protein
VVVCPDELGRSTFALAMTLIVLRGR